MVRQPKGIVTGETPHTASGPHPTVGVHPIVPSTGWHAGSDVRHGPLSRMGFLYLRNRARRMTSCLVRLWGAKMSSVSEKVDAVS